MAPVRPSPGDESGFTLIELLVVILIIGILAAIAIVVFTGQSRKAYDAAAKQTLDTAQTAVETYRVDHGGFCGATVAQLQSIEPTLTDASSLSVSSCTGGDPETYAVSVRSNSTDQTGYTLTYTDGQLARTCAPTGDGCVNGTW